MTAITGNTQLLVNYHIVKSANGLKLGGLAEQDTLINGRIVAGVSEILPALADTSAPLWLLIPRNSISNIQCPL